MQQLACSERHGPRAAPRRLALRVAHAAIGAGAGAELRSKSGSKAATASLSRIETTCSLTAKSERGFSGNLQKASPAVLHSSLWITLWIGTACACARAAFPWPFNAVRRGAGPVIHFRSLCRSFLARIPQARVDKPSARARPCRRALWGSHNVRAAPSARPSQARTSRLRPAPCVMRAGGPTARSRRHAAARGPRPATRRQAGRNAACRCARPAAVGSTSDATFSTVVCG